MVFSECLSLSVVLMKPKIPDRKTAIWQMRVTTARTPVTWPVTRTELREGKSNWPPSTSSDNGVIENSKITLLTTGEEHFIHPPISIIATELWVDGWILSKTWKKLIAHVMDALCDCSIWVYFKNMRYT